MKNFVIPFLFILCLSCSSQNGELKEFNEFLGEEKAEALNELVISFQEFLDINYPGNDLGVKTKQFLVNIERYNNPQWEFERQINKNVIMKIEKSGLRKEMYIYDSEDYTSDFNIFDIFHTPDKNSATDTFGFGELNLDELEEIEDELIPLNDSFSYQKEEPRESIDYSGFNIYGKYLYALAKYYQNDTVIYQYIDVKLVAGDISPVLMSGGFHLSYSTEELKRPIVQRMIAVEFYCPMLEYIIKKESIL